MIQTRDALAAGGRIRVSRSILVLERQKLLVTRNFHGYKLLGQRKHIFFACKSKTTTTKNSNRDGANCLTKDKHFKLEPVLLDWVRNSLGGVIVIWNGLVGNVLGKPLIVLTGALQKIHRV